MAVLLDPGKTTSAGFTGARFIRHAFSSPAFDVLALAVAMILATLRAALVLAVRFAVALCLSVFAAPIAAVPLPSEVRTTDAELCSTTAALSTKKGETILLHDRPPRGRRALDNAPELWDAQGGHGVELHAYPRSAPAVVRPATGAFSLRPEDIPPPTPTPRLRRG
jgi:hypothetical protein